MITREQFLSALEVIKEYRKQCWDDITKIDDAHIDWEVNPDTKITDIFHLFKVGLGIRILNALSYHEIKTIGDLTKLRKRDFQGMRHLGNKSINEIFRVMKNLGINSN